MRRWMKKKNEDVILPFEKMCNVIIRLNKSTVLYGICFDLIFSNVNIKERRIEKKKYNKNGEHGKAEIQRTVKKIPIWKIRN